MRSHGFISTYNAGCRCMECRAARSAEQTRRRDRKRQYRHRGGGRPPKLDPMRWADNGSCRTVPNRVFFPAGGQGTYELAKSICAGCPVRDACLEYALRTDQPAGCWGGHTPEERWHLRQASA